MFATLLVVFAFERAETINGLKRNTHKSHIKLVQIDFSAVNEHKVGWQCTGLKRL